MKNIIVTAILLLCSCCQTFASPQKNAATACVAFYNVENLFDTLDNPLKDDDEFTPAGRNHYTKDIYNKKLQNIAKALQAISIHAGKPPAIIGMAEVENRQVLHDLVHVSFIQPIGYKYLLYESRDARGIDVALLYQPSVFRVLQSKPVQTSNNKYFEMEGTRDILYVSGILFGDTIHLLINHWPSRREGAEVSDAKRRAVAAINRRLSDSILATNKHAKIIVMGDLNDNPTDASVITVLKCTSQFGRLDNTVFYNPWINIYRSGRGTVAFNDHWDLFDQILLSSSFTSLKHLRFSKAEIFDKDFLKTKTGKFAGYPHRAYSGKCWLNGYSDHFPVLVHLSVD